MSESALVVWLSTYLVHSTALLGLTWLLARGGWVRGVARREWLWRAAMLGGLTSATAQTLVEVRPVTGSLPWPGAPASGAVEPDVPTRGLTRERLALAPTVERLAPRPESSMGSRPAVDPGVRPAVAARAPSPAWLGLGAGLWLLFVAWRAERALGRRRPLGQGPWHDTLRALEAEAGLRRRVRLTVSDRLRVPVALGLLRPEICVPARALEGLPRDLVRPALAHELAHHVRRDPFWLGLAVLVRSALVVQPLNRAAAKELARLAELSADAWAVRRTGDRLALARCLTEVAGWLCEPAPPRAACAMVRRRGGLEERVRALLDGAAVPEGGARRRHSALAGALLAAPLVLPGWGVAARPAPGPARPPAPALARYLDTELARVEARLAALAVRRLSPEQAARRAALGGRSRELRARLAQVLSALPEHEPEDEDDSRIHAQEGGPR